MTVLEIQNREEQFKTELRPLLNVPQVCEITGLKKSSVYKLMSKGELPWIDLGRRMIDPADLSAFLLGRRKGGWNMENA